MSRKGYVVKCYRDYNEIRIGGNKFIYLGFEKVNLDQIKSIPVERDVKKKIHIFLSHPDHVNEYLFDSLVYITSMMENYKVIFHTPVGSKDVQKLFMTLMKDYVFSAHLHYDYYLDKYPVTFLIPGDISHELTCHYYEKHIQASIDVAYTVSDSFEEECPFWNKVRRNHPELFKEEIIEGFKNYCPEFIAAFDNDDDIWDYIMETGEWVGKPKVDAKATLTIPESFNKEEAEDYVRTKIQKVFKGVD